MQQFLNFYSLKGKNRKCLDKFGSAPYFLLACDTEQTYIVVSTPVNPLPLLKSQCPASQCSEARLANASSETIVECVSSVEKDAKCI